MSIQTALFDVAGIKYTVRLTEIDTAQKEAAALSVVAGKVALRAGMRALLRVLRRGLLKRLPRGRTGKLRRSIRSKITVEARNSRVTGKLTLGSKEAWYAHLLERGTGQYGPKSRPYRVWNKAKGKKAIFIPGSAHPVHHVNVKGIKPRRMVQQTEQQDMNAARRAFNDAFDQEVRRVTKVWKVR